MHVLNYLWYSIVTASLVHALPLPGDSAVGVIWTFPNGTWIENLAVRQNGEVLCTSLTKAALYMVNPFQHTAQLVHQFDQGDDLLGITEVENDVFAIVSANISFTTSTAMPGSAALWRVDMAAWEQGMPNAVTLVSRLLDVGLPDGIVALPDQLGLALLADAAKGRVWKVDVWTGEHSVAFQSELFRPNTSVLPLGIDGLSIWKDNLFFTNIARSVFGHVPISQNGSATGPIQQIAETPFGDDFAIAVDGTAYVVGDNTLFGVDLEGSAKILAGGPDDLTLEGATSAQFGRTSMDDGVLYIGTNGGLLSPVDGEIRGGQLLAINTKLFD
ncbi:hypothetical protein NA57DRAFT_79597 [Rhizodiscina lignyota]|uniref:SMP-30/Gluconolactonase/LRE-like region domain-containing protein n=1 Tax=Rhizodiscina lignyota TaxID=1504668 RepID=A0A9P4M6R7_9PEZI|nr:hypothetical protein NA57DRAFT_79597 [Rhizodiscina lignyota]